MGELRKLFLAGDPFGHERFSVAGEKLSIGRKKILTKLVTFSLA